MVKTSPSNAGGAGSIPGWGAKILHASGSKNQNIKQKQHCNKFNKDFKNGPHQKILNKKRKRKEMTALNPAAILLNFSSVSDTIAEASLMKPNSKDLP